MARRGKGWFGDSKGHARAGKMGGRPRKSETTYSEVRRVKPKRGKTKMKNRGWFGDSDEYVEDI